VPAAEREYRGDPNDRKALVKHRQRVKVGRPCHLQSLQLALMASKA
jgi:hypothetical protein